MQQEIDKYMNKFKELGYYTCSDDECSCHEISECCSDSNCDCSSDSSSGSESSSSESSSESEEEVKIDYEKMFLKTFNKIQNLATVECRRQMKRSAGVILRWLQISTIFGLVTQVVSSSSLIRRRSKVRILPGPHLNTDSSSTVKRDLAP